MKNYKIAEIAVRIDGDKIMYWINNVGFHANQGGMEFGWGNFGTNDLEQSLEILKRKLIEVQNEIESLARNKNENPNQKV